jgi:hypothetical protein
MAAVLTEKERARESERELLFEPGAVVVTGLFSLFLLRKHFITDFFKKKNPAM